MASLKALTISSTPVEPTLKVSNVLRALALAPMVVGLMLAGATLSEAIAAEKDKQPARVKYQKDRKDGLGLFTGRATHVYGYREERLDNGNWLVVGTTKSKSDLNARYLAIYRASEMTQSEGRKYVKVVSAGSDDILIDLITTSGTPVSTMFLGTKYAIMFEMSDSPDVGENCANDVLRPSCKTIDAESAMQEIRPNLKFPGEK